jgi:THO complex subunit 2
LATWFKDEALFNTDSKKGTPDLLGFKMAPVDPSPVTWVGFKKFVKKIHYKLGSVGLRFLRRFAHNWRQSKAMVACLTRSSGEFMHVSNAILVLKEILPVFPLGVINSGTGFFLDEALQTLLSTEKRGDIKILATSYQGQLRMARKDWEVASEQAGISSEVDSCFSSYSVTHICV